MKKHPINICFDVDDTLWKIRPKHHDQVPDYDLIQVLRWFHKNGDNVYVWSGGGVDYAKMIVRKLGLDDMVKVISKPPLYKNDPKIDLVFDDEEITLGKVNIEVYRPWRYENNKTNKK